MKNVNSLGWAEQKQIQLQVKDQKDVRGGKKIERLNRPLAQAHDDALYLAECFDAHSLCIPWMLNFFFMSYLEGFELVCY